MPTRIRTDAGNPTDGERRRFIKAATVATLGLSFPSQVGARSASYLAYVGTYTSKTKSEGIYVCRFDAGAGELKQLSTIRSDDPAFLTIDGKHRFLYAANETSEYRGVASGYVSAFAIDQRSGALLALNQQPSMGIAPCNLTIDKTGKNVLVANYTSGNVAVLPVRGDGRLGEATDTQKHTGSGINPDRQKEPHAHCIVLDEGNRFAFSADLGADKVMIYRLDPSHGKLIPNSQAFVPLKPGAGPRHFAIHPARKFAYVINELDSTVTAFAFDKIEGTLKEVQSISTLPAGFTGTSYCADIHVHPTGRFLYGSNRGHNTIAVFAIDRLSGKLTLVQHQSTLGNWPRNFALDPMGQFLLVANQYTDNIATFRIDQKTGQLASTGYNLGIPSPVCIKLIPSFI